MQQILSITFADLSAVKKSAVSEKKWCKFTPNITNDLFYSNNIDKILKKHNKKSFNIILCNLDDTILDNSDLNKYSPYISVLQKGFPMDEIKITDCFIHEKENELWVVADHSNSDIEEKFFEIAYNIWDDIFIDVDVIFVGENELDRSRIPKDFKQIKIKP